jgi:hypothetical protein
LGIAARDPLEPEARHQRRQMIVASVIAKLAPMQIRGPSPKGSQA